MIDQIMAWDQLPEEHPDRAKQCRVCGTKWIDEETAAWCASRHSASAVEDLNDAVRDLGQAIVKALKLEEIVAWLSRMLSRSR